MLTDAELDAIKRDLCGGDRLPLVFAQAKEANQLRQRCEDLELALGEVVRLVDWSIEYSKGQYGDDFARLKWYDVQVGPRDIADWREALRGKP